MAGYAPLPGALPPELALFPLQGALLLPRAWLPLHIFEPRYVAMLGAVLATPERLIGMIQPEGEGLARIGCAGRISSFSEAPDGTYSITLRGISRFRLGETLADPNPWVTGKVTWQGFAADLGEEPASAGFDQGAFLALLERFARSRGREIAPAAREALEALSEDALISEVAMSGGFTPADKQGLLEAPGLGERRALLVSLMTFALHGDRGEGTIQ